MHVVVIRPPSQISIEYEKQKQHHQSEIFLFIELEIFHIFFSSPSTLSQLPIFTLRHTIFML